METTTKGAAMDSAARGGARDVGREWSGRRVLLAGLGGIGGAVAHRLASCGARIFGTYHSRPGSAETLGESLPAGTWAGAAPLEVTDPESALALAGPRGAAAGALGEVDTVVISTGHRHDLEFFAGQDPDVYQEILAVELLGPMHLVRAVLPGMQERGFGRIVLVGSDSGKAGTMADAASSAARAGLAGFARSIARETARQDITINVVSPGPTDTGLLQGMLADEGLTGKVMKGTVGAVPKRRAGTAQEIAEAVAYLAGPHSGFTTGQVLSVSGGLTM